ncbi:RagB/SusD family nutrient uptake outer membrane protein [Hwangdonia sp.]|uniref:RagB/SusD family nutrient uptake outer membrane protein n=1 Tax=Hwangdonia sp. TaxID=1883432 RepID=UPI003AB6121C
MRNTHIKIVAFVFFLGFISCDSRLDLAPTDILIEKDVFANVENAEAALSDVYYKLFLASSGATHVIPDASLPYVGLPETSSYYKYSGGNLDATDQEVENIWIEYYEVINVANVFIDKVPVFGNYDEAKELQHIAEAKFNRAYAYWALLSFYGYGGLTGNFDGLCVPLQLMPYNGFNPSELIPRNTNGEVYAQIIKDLTEALVDLPENHGDNIKTRVRATKATAQALLSRVQLYKRDYQACVEASNDVLANTNYTLETELLDLFPLNEEGTTSDFSDEVIFGFPVSSNGGNFQYGIHGIYYYNKYIWVDADFINSMDASDKRRTELIFEGNPHITNPTTANEKTTFKFNNPEQRDDIQIIRLAEVILNKAEALAQIDGVNTESVALLNKIKERSGLSPVDVSDFATKEELLTALYNERYIETAFEGRGRFDFIRTNRPLRNPDLTENEKVFPIPQREIDLSGGVLVQNPK